MPVGKIYLKPTIKKLPPEHHDLADTIKCYVCRDSGILFHRTTPGAFFQIYRESKLRPGKCNAKVLSFSRSPANDYGGIIRLVFHEKDIPRKREMCYVKHDEHDTRLLDIILTRFVNQKGLGYSPHKYNIASANLGLTVWSYRDECEVFSKTCIPLLKAIRIEYWLSYGTQSVFTGIPPVLMISTDRLESKIDEIREVKRIADELKIPFEIKSNFRVVDCYGGWFPINRKTLNQLKNGEKPQIYPYPIPKNLQTTTWKHHKIPIRDW